MDSEQFGKGFERGTRLLIPYEDAADRIHGVLPQDIGQAFGGADQNRRQVLRGRCCGAVVYCSSNQEKAVWMMERQEYMAAREQVESKEYILPVLDGAIKIRIDSERRSAAITIPRGWVSIVQGGGREV